MILATYTSTVYMALAVVIKLQFISDGVMSSHSVGDGGTGLISTVKLLVGGVYNVDEGVPYCSVDNTTQHCIHMN